MGGDHFARWLACDVYDEEVPAELAVHSLEHGAVWVTYDPELPAEQVVYVGDTAHGPYGPQPIADVRRHALAVGDALVAQIPALLISVAAAMVVSRVGKKDDIGSQIRNQVFSSAKSLGLTAGIVGALGLIPGMPNVVFLLLAGGLAALARWTYRRDQRARAAGEQRANGVASGKRAHHDLRPNRR